MSMSGKCDAIYSAASLRWHCSADFSVHNRQMRSRSVGESPAVGRRAARLNLFSDMIVFSSYATQVIASFMILTMILLFFSRATVSAGDKLSSVGMGLAYDARRIFL